MDHRKVFHELVRGREFANQLRQVIHNGHDDHQSATPFVQSLVKNVLRSFTNTLFLLDKYPSYQSHEVNSQMQQRDSCFIIPTKSEDSQESCKSFTSKNRRGCYKKKRTTQAWEKASKTPIVDGHQWRKYGQKAILQAKYSRNYYRCTHKYDQNCQATKQEQRIQEEPPLYKTTYYGHHTCNKLLEYSNNISPPDTSILLSFNNTLPTPTKQECPFLSSFHPSPTVNKEEVVIPSSSSDDFFLYPESILDDSSRHNNNNNNNVTPSPDHCHWDVMSNEILYDYVDLDDVYQPFAGFW